eukprot:633803-Pelagomonas_calceolata.AAC.6
MAGGRGSASQRTCVGFAVGDVILVGFARALHGPCMGQTQLHAREWALQGTDNNACMCLKWRTKVENTDTSHWC